MTFLKINWAPNEKLFEIGGFGIHIYSLMFIIAFLYGLRLYKKMFIKENVDEKYLEPMFVFMVVSTLLGARLGEVFFYNWEYFQDHLIEILLPIKAKADGSGYEFIGFKTRGHPDIRLPKGSSCVKKVGSQSSEFPLV